MYKRLESLIARESYYKLKKKKESNLKYKNMRK
jgi:hypothetical protein